MFVWFIQGPYIRTLRQYPADFYLSQLEKDQLPSPVMEYLNLVSSHGYPGIEASDVEQQKRAAQSRKYLGIINSK